MVFNYVKFSIRLLLRNPVLTFIKITGLAIGLAVFIVLWQYSQSELSSDQQWRESGNVYRVVTKGRWTDDKTKWDESQFGVNCPLLVDQMARTFPQITEITNLLFQRNFVGQSYVVDHGADVFLSVDAPGGRKLFKETRLAYGDPNLFRFFELPLVAGDPNSALNLAGSVVLSEDMAQKYFGESDIIGRSILLNNQISLTVTGIFKNLPHNTHLNFDAVLSSKAIEQQYKTSWQQGISPVVYVRLKEDTDVNALVEKINEDMHATIKHSMWGNWEYGDAEILMQRLDEMPYQSYINDSYNSRSKVIIRILQSASLVILVLALINHINLTSAANMKRRGEVVARRVVGAKLHELTAQFITEAFVTNLIALLLALTIIQVAAKSLEAIVGLYVLPWNSMFKLTGWVLVAAFVNSILITGIYPAWAIVRARSGGPIDSGSSRRWSLAVFFTTLQYVGAISILVFAFTVKGQLSYILNRDLGLTREDVLVVDLPVVRNNDFDARLNEFIATVNDLNPATSRCVAGEQFTLISLIQPGVGAGIGVETQGGVNENYIPVYGIRMVAGRNFLPDAPGESNSILLSEITASRLGFASPNDAIGSKVIASVDDTGKDAYVVGVFADYKTLPLLNSGFFQSGGLALAYKNYLLPQASWATPQKVSFRVQPETFTQTLQRIEDVYKESFDDPLFNWYFLNDVITGKYKQHLVISNQVALFSFLAIGIACLGLLGMMMYKINNKIKEIGIRKVLGANLRHIAQILLRMTMKQIVVASMIGTPVAWYLIDQYLERFSERIDLQWWHFGLPVALLVCIMFGTVTTIVWKAAKGNPVDALKHE